MQIPILSLSAVALAFGISALGAQIPHGSALMSHLNNSPPMEGLLLVDRSGGATPITGLLPATYPHWNVSSVQLDPVDGRVWIGGPSFQTTRVWTVRIQGSTISNAVEKAFIPGISGAQALVFDANGNAIVAPDDQINFFLPNQGGGLFRIDRWTGAVRRLIGNGTAWPFAHYGGCNAVCTDDAGNLYFGVSRDGAGVPARVYRLAHGPHGEYTGPATLVGTVSPPASSTIISSVAWAPARGARPERIWFTTPGAVGTSVGYLENGVATVLPSFGPSAWIDYDAIGDDFWLLSSGIDPDEIRLVDHVGVTSLVAQVPPGGVNGFPSAIDAHDAIHARTKVLPQFVSGAPTTIELCTTCPSGHFGALLLVGPFFDVLGSGIAGADGRIYLALPGLTFDRGTPGALALQSICFDPATAQIVFGPSVSWPRN